VLQQKTQCPFQFEVTPSTREVAMAWDIAAFIGRSYDALPDDEEITECRGASKVRKAR